MTDRTMESDSLALRRAIRSCTACPAHTLASGPVPPTFPATWRDPRIIVIAEAPGQREDRLLRPLIGPSGSQVRRWLSEAQVEPETVAWANAVCCWPRRREEEGGVTPTPAEIAACHDNLRSTLAYARARYVLVLGSVAVRALELGENISSARGRWVKVREKWGDCYYLPTFHPAYCLRNPGARRAARSDVMVFSFYSLGHFDPEHVQL